MTTSGVKVGGPVVYEQRIERRDQRPNLAGLVLLCVALVSAACAGGSSGTENTTSGTDEVPQVLGHFGSLAVFEERQVVDVGPAASSVSLAGGALVNVPAGAFPEATELTVTVVDLDFDSIVDEPVWGEAYVLSTDEEVDLAVPVTLVLPRSAAQVNVIQHADDQWRRVSAVGSDSATVEIKHFSEVATVAVEPSATQAGFNEAPPAGLSAGGEVLSTCVLSLSTLLASNLLEDERLDELTDGPLPMYTEQDFTEFFYDYSLGICVRALINVEAQGFDVSVDCVGSTVSDTIRIADAVELCRGADAEETAEASNDADEDAATSAPEPSSDTSEPGETRRFFTDQSADNQIARGEFTTNGELSGSVEVAFNLTILGETTCDRLSAVVENVPEVETDVFAGTATWSWGRTAGACVGVMPPIDSSAEVALRAEIGLDGLALVFSVPDPDDGEIGDISFLVAPAD